MSGVPTISPQEAFLLGEIYRFGDRRMSQAYGPRIECDRAKTEQLWTYAAENGDANAQMGMGDIFSDRFSDSRSLEDEQKAFRWYLRAAQQGHALAQFKVSVAYERGLGVDKDLYEAFKWRYLSLVRGYTAAEMGIERLRGAFSGHEDDKARREVSKIWIKMKDKPNGLRH